MDEGYYSALERAYDAYRREQSDANFVALLALAKGMARELDGDVQCIACDEWVPLEEAELDAGGWLCDNCADTGRGEDDNG